MNVMQEKNKRHNTLAMGVLEDMVGVKFKDSFSFVGKGVTI